MARILIVDDEWLTRLEIEEILSGLGYEVVGQAETGEEAVGMVRNLEPDLVIMDVAMPGEMNGIDAARVIKAEWGTAIIFISGHGKPEYIEAAKEIAPFGYLMKPFDERVLYATVEIALTKRALELKLKRAHGDLERRVEIRTAELAEANRQLRKENEAHKRTVEALRESEKKLNAILDATTETIVLFDRKGTVHVANKTTCDRLTTTKEEIIGKKLYDFFSPEAAEGRRQEWNKVFETGKPVFFEDSRAGMIFEQVAYPIFGDGDQVEMVVAFANDKTDQKQAEEALHESEKHSHSFMENAKGFAVYRLKIDPENFYKAHLVFVSPNLKDIVGVSPQEEFSQWFKNVHEDDLPSLINAQNESVQFGVPLDQYFRLKGVEGEWRWLHVISNPVFGSEGTPEYYNGIMIDVTAQKQAEQALHESERHLKCLMESATNFAVYRLISDDSNPNFLKVIFVSPSIKDIMGVSEPMHFETWFENIHPDDVERIVRANIEASKTLRFNETMRVYHPQKKKWVRIHAVSTGLEDQEQQQYVNGILLDVTSQRQAKEALRKSGEKKDIEKIKSISGT